jgi:hypothetical protein
MGREHSTPGAGRGGGAPARGGGAGPAPGDGAGPAPGGRAGPAPGGGAAPPPAPGRAREKARPGVRRTGPALGLGCRVRYWPSGQGRRGHGMTARVEAYPAPLAQMHPRGRTATPRQALCQPAASRPGALTACRRGSAAPCAGRSCHGPGARPRERARGVGQMTDPQGLPIAGAAGARRNDRTRDPAPRRRRAVRRRPPREAPARPRFGGVNLAGAWGLTPPAPGG